MLRMVANEALDEVVVTGSRIARQGELGDYKIYSLPEPTTVAARQTKQVRFLERDGVAYERVYRAGVLNADEESRPTGVVLKLRNEERAGLGVALPGGSVAVMQPDGAGGVLLAGQDRFEDKGVGLPVRLNFGQSADVRVQTRLVKTDSSRRGAVTTQRSEIETTVTNARSEDVTVELVADAAMQRGFRIRSQSVRSRVDDTGYPVWTLSVPANGAATLKATWTTTD
nr:DUF4139 domain-containing protein [Brevundimonas naejangsanensis]